MSLWKKIQSYFKPSQKKFYPIGEVLKFDTDQQALGLRPDFFGFSQMLEVLKFDSKLSQLYDQYTQEALKPDRDQATLDLLALEAKEHNATFEIKTSEDGSSFDVLMHCEIKADPSYLYFDKKISSKDN